MDWTLIFTLYVVLLISLVCHEASHALFALLGGDPTAYLGGQVTLNPVPHIRREPFGMVILPIATILISSSFGTLLCFGYASTPIDPLWALRHSKRAALMSAAGPLANFVLAGIAFAVLYFLVQSGEARVSLNADPFLKVMPMGTTEGPIYAVCLIAYTFLFLNLLLGIFNLYPFPPLDGAGIVQGIAPKATEGFFNLFKSMPFLSILGLIVIWNTILTPLYWTLFNLLDWLE